MCAAPLCDQYIAAFGKSDEVACTTSVDPPTEAWDTGTYITVRGLVIQNACADMWCAHADAEDASQDDEENLTEEEQIARALKMSMGE